MEFNKKWNVIEEDDFKKALYDVFDDVSKALSKTLGPYGTTTIIEQFGEMHITKDGYQVLKSLSYEDPVLNNILILLFRISAQVVVQVGDGSTSSIIAANELMKAFKESGITTKYRSKEIIDAITKCVNAIVSKLYQDSIKIDPNDDSFDEIKKIATVSTNSYEEIAAMIADIYRKTKNPVIKYLQSKTNDTTYDIIDGYQAKYTYIDSIFATNDDGICKINGAYVVMFDYKIDMESIDIISAAAQKAVQSNERVVVIAPAYDRLLLNHLKQTLTLEFKSRGTSTCVYCKADLINNMSQIMYNDFAIMCGGSVIREQYNEDAVKPENIEDYIGHVESVDIAPDSILIKGFDKRSDEMYNKLIFDAEFALKKAEADYENKGIVDIGLTDIKTRLTNLKGSMGIIYVGGDTTLAKKATYDLVEDAVKASESAYKYGYNIGGNRAILYAIADILCEDQEDNKLTELEKEIYDCLGCAFSAVFTQIVENKMRNITEANEYISKAIEEMLETDEHVTYDIVNDKVSKDIINSCRTDIEILRGALSVISLLLTSNQYISITRH